MGRKLKESSHYYLIVDLEYQSKEDLWSYRPKKAMIILSKEDLDKIENYKSLLKTPAFENSAGMAIVNIEYPVTVEEVWFSDLEEDVVDEDCTFYPEGSKICIRGYHGFMSFSMWSHNDCWDIVEGDVDLSLLKPVVEWKDYKPNLDLED